MSEQRRLWCSLHHSFWRDCSACVEADYANLERQLVEAQGKLDAAKEYVMALKPFIAFAIHIGSDSPDDAELLPDLAVAHFRNAKASCEALDRILSKEGE